MGVVFERQKKSEADIVNGHIHGRFRRWYESGQLAEDAGFSNGVPHGISTAFYESGYQKANVSMNCGKVVEQTFWQDGEHRPWAISIPKPILISKREQCVTSANKIPPLPLWILIKVQDIFSYLNN